MSLQEKYLADIQKITDEFTKKEQGIIDTYVNSIVRFKVGDILERSGAMIIVDTIKYSKPNSFYNRTDFPVPVYHGKQLTQKSVPRKDGSVSSFYAGDNIKKVG